MRRLVVSSFVTLDGVGEDPAGFEGTDIGGWSVPYFDEEMAATALEMLRSCDLFLCGRVTYEGFAKYGPALTGEYSHRLNELPKRVVSKTLTEPLEWNAQLLEGEVVEAVSELKRSPGLDIVSYGGGELMATLLGAGLVDECKLSIHPIALGSGKRLFRDGLQLAAMKLSDVKQLESGLVMLTYAPAR